MMMFKQNYKGKKQKNSRPIRDEELRLTTRTIAVVRHMLSDVTVGPVGCYFNIYNYTIFTLDMSRDFIIF